MVDSDDDVLRDLVAEYDRLEGILGELSPAEWASPCAVPDWSVRDVVVHLAQSEEAVLHTLAAPVAEWNTRERTLDDEIDAGVRAENASAIDVFARWRAARRASVAALRQADPNVRVRWAAAPLKPRTLATTRLAEHWAHALDICEPLGIALPDTDRLRHVAWLGHSTLPYAMRLAGLEPIDVYCTLDAPSGAVWTFGPSTASARISGSAGAFCRVGARRLAGTDSGLAVSGPAAGAALDVLRNYAL
jgi:uncharacterized protein (TIGR03084 family)